MRINSNLSAINAHRQSGLMAQASERLSGGLRINRAGDDAAGLAISERMRGQIRGLGMASRNASDSISLVQTAEGGLSQTHSILQRMRELAVQASNDTYTDADRRMLQGEMKQLQAEITRIGNTTEFNTRQLLDGSAKGVAGAVAGGVRVNNNSGIVIDPGKMNAMANSVKNDRNWAFDGAYMLMKVNQAFDSANNAVFRAEDFRLVGPDGSMFEFRGLGSDTKVQANNLTAGEIIADGGVEFVMGAAGALNDAKNLGAASNGITLGAAVNHTQVTTVADGSILASGSSFTMNNQNGGVDVDIEFVGIGGNNKIQYTSEGVLRVGGEVDLAAGASLTLDNGAVIRNDGGGKVTVVSGSLELEVGQSLEHGVNTTAHVIASQSTLTAASTVTEDAVLVEAGNYVIAADAALNQNVTIGNSVNLVSGTDISLLAKGSTLSAGSDLDFNNTDGTLAIMVNGKEVVVEWDNADNILKVGGQTVAAGKSITLEDGTVLTHQTTLDNPAAATGKISITAGKITIAEDMDASDFNFSVAKDSTLAINTEVMQDMVLMAGTVITDASQGGFSGSVTLGHGGTNLQFSANADNALAASYFETNVGDTLAFVFTRYQAASSSLANSLMSQIGANSGQMASLSISDMRAGALGVDDLNIGTKMGAAGAIAAIDAAIGSVSHQRGQLGAVQSRLEHTVRSLDNAAENQQASESRIRDANVARELIGRTTANILRQTSLAMVAQANMAQQSVLRLIG